MRYAVSTGYVSKRVGDEIILVRTEATHDMLVLSGGVSCYVWESLVYGATKEAIVEALGRKFWDRPLAKIRAEVAGLIEKLTEESVIEPDESPAAKQPREADLPESYTLPWLDHVDLSELFDPGLIVRGYSTTGSTGQAGTQAVCSVFCTTST